MNRLSATFGLYNIAIDYYKTRSPVTSPFMGFAESDYFS